MRGWYARHESTLLKPAAEIAKVESSSWRHGFELVFEVEFVALFEVA
jgi:hypothetical protein